VRANVDPAEKRRPIAYCEMELGPDDASWGHSKPMVTGNAVDHLGLKPTELQFEGLKELTIKLEK